MNAPKAPAVGTSVGRRLPRPSQGRWPLPGRPRPAIGIALLALLSLASALVAARVAGPDGPWLWYYDMPRIMYPYAVFTHDAAAAWRLPLWTDNLGLGFPLYAEGNIGSFYLPNLLFFQLAPLAALDLGRTAHLTFAGVGAGLVGRRLSGSWIGAGVAAVGAVLNGGIIGKLEWSNFIVAYSWAPWMFLPLVRRPRPSRRGLLFAATAWGIAGLASQANTWVLLGICAVVVLVVTAPRRQTILRVVGFGLLGSAIAAVQLIPLFVLWSLSARAGGLPEWSLFTDAATVLDPLLPGFANAFVPLSNGAWNLGLQWYPYSVGGLHEAGAYVGLPLLGLAGVALTARRSRPFLVAIAVMIAIPVVASFHPSFWQSTPVLSGLRAPVRSYMLVALMLSFLAAVGVSRATRAATRAPAIWATAVVGAFVAAYLGLVAFAMYLPQQFERLGVLMLQVAEGDAGRFRANALSTLLRPYPVLLEVGVGVVAIGLIWGAASRRLTRRPARAGLLLATALPLLLLAPAANPSLPIRDFSHADRPYVQAVLGRTPSRFLALRSPSWYDGNPDQLASLGVRELRTYSSLSLAATDQLADSIWSGWPDPAKVNSTLARAVGVDVMASFQGLPCPGRDPLHLAQDDTTICRLDAARPPYWMAEDAVGASASPVAASASPVAASASPVAASQRSILTSVLRAAGAVPVDRTVDPQRALATWVSATTVAWDDGHAEVRVEAPADGWVYLDRAWWPAWRVTLDDQPVQVDRALGGQLIKVGAGSHVIREDLVAWDAGLGLILGILGVAAALIWLRFGPSRGTERARARRRRPPKPVNPTLASPKPAHPEPASPRETLGPPSAAVPEAPVTRTGTADAAERTDAMRRTVEGTPGAGSASPSSRMSTVPPPTATVGTPSPIRDLRLVAMGAAVLLLAGTLLTPAALVAWPLLTVLPGWLLVSRVAPGLSIPGRLGAGVVVSVVLGAHAVNLVATGLGFGASAIVIASFGLLVISWLLATRTLPFLGEPVRPTLEGVRSTLREDRAAWLLAAATTGIVLAVLGASAWHETAQGWVSGGWNWSDFLVHVSIGNSIVHGNFPPEVPYFAGVPLTYHWFGDFHGAILATIGGVPLIPVYILSSAGLAGALSLLVWELARRLTHSRRAAVIAAILVCFGGGLGWLRLLFDMANGQGTLLNLLANHAYDNSWDPGWPYFRVASVFGTGLLVHRATTFGLPGLVTVVLLAHVSLGRRPAGVLLAGVLAALLAPFQFFFFPATYLIVLLMVIARRGWRRPTFLRDAVLFLAPIVLAIPFVLGAILLQGERQAVKMVAGWSEARFGDGPAAVAFFYLTNLGLPVALAILAGVWRGRFPQRSFLLLWLVALFAVPNLVVVSSVEFDMNKYFQVMWVGAAVLAAWLMRRWPLPLVAAALAFAAMSPALVGAWHVLDSRVALTADQERAGRWIEANAPDRAVFVTDAWINSPVDLGGRLRISTFGPYAANLGYNPDPRAADIKSIYCDGDAAATSLMARYRATYVLSTGGGLDCGGHQPTSFGTSAAFETAYRSGGVTIWKLRQ